MRTRPHRPIGPRRGNYAMLVGVSFSVLLGFAALAIDSAYIHLAFVQAQAAADAGAHAAVIELRQSGDVDQARTVAEAVINANTLMGASALVESAEDIEFGGWDFQDRTFDDSADYVNAVRVNVRKTDDSPNGALDTLMMRMFGVDYGEAAAVTPSTAALRFREIVVVQDVTGSFADEMTQARDADLAFLDAINANQNPGDRIAMVTFVGDAVTWTDLEFVDREYGSIRSQWETLDWCHRDYWPWNPHYPAYAHSAPQMMDCSYGQSGAYSYYDSGTNQGSGILEALDVFFDSSSDVYALKTIVLVSDGRPQCIPSTSTCDAGVALEGLDAADQAADEEVSIYSVSFNETYDATQSAYMESLTRGYGRFYETPDPSELEGILAEIAASIPIALVE